MATILPVKYEELLVLQKLGIQQSAIKFTNVTMESDKQVVVREDSSIAIINTKTKAVTKLPVTVESAIMNPTSNVLGLRAQSVNLQIYNLDMKTRMKVTKMPEKEPVIFWRWLDPKTVAIVTGAAVYHWSMDGQTEPKKQFQRQNDGRQVQIIGYAASADNKWLLLQGLAKGASGLEGALQLYSVEHKKFQPTLNAHGGCFANVKLDGRDANSNLFCFTRKDGSVTKLSIIEVGNPDKAAAFKAMTDTEIRDGDFVVSMTPDPKHGLLFALTKQGFLYLFDVHSGKQIFAKQVSQTAMFLSCPHTDSGGVVTLDRNGRVCLFAADENNLVPYINNTINDYDLGVRTAHRYNLSGAGDVFQKRFESLLGMGKYQEAAKLAAEAPQGVLRTTETIQRFRGLTVPQGQPLPDLAYFQMLLKTSVLNAEESLGLCERVLQLNAETGKRHCENWITQAKLTNSEKLGDLLAKFDMKLACSVYLRANVPEKTILCFCQMGHFNKIPDYAKSVGYTPNYADLLMRLHATRRDDAKPFAAQLVERQMISVNDVINIFLGNGKNDVETTTSFLLDYLKARGDRDEDAELQTKLLEINLRAMPQVADAILESTDYQMTKYDRSYIARLCESARLFQRALEHFEDLDDIKRVLQMGLGTNALNAEFLIKFFGDLRPEEALSCLKDLLQYQQSGGNLQLVVEVAKRYSDQLSPAKLIPLFEEFDCFSGLYLYLGNFVNFTEDKEVIFKYIQAAAEVGQVAQIELICRENDHYDPIQVKTFLLETNKVKDPRPLIHVCDRHGFVPELCSYLYSNQMYKFIEVYVQKMNPGATPKVIGSLLDLNAPEDQIRNLVNSVRPPQCPVGELVAEVESRVRLSLLLPWLEARLHEGLEDAALHNALAKIYVDINNNPQHFLMTNKFYDSAEVGEYCESRDPHLAFIAYKRAWGPCDKQLLEITNKHGFYKDQSRYLVERQDADLWAMALEKDNEHRRALIDQVVATALPESRNPEDISVAVKAFMAAEMPNELIELLERIVLSGSADRTFRDNKSLQNLLILTAIKADKSRVAGYIDRLDNYDGPDIAKIAVSDQYQLYEEGFLIYKKFKKGAEAIQVLLDNIGDMERANEFAVYLGEPEVWAILGRKQLDEKMVKEAIESFLKAEDATHYADVIAASNEATTWEELITYLKMARSKVRDRIVDNEIIYAYAKTENLTALEEFISMPNHAKVDEVGDRCFEEKLYAAAKVLFSYISNFAKLASCLVHLEKYQEAVDAARKANSISTWKDVCYACVDARMFRLAQMCGVNIIVFMDHLHDLIKYYETGGHFAELIALLEQGINLDRAHQGIYTQLGILYSKYKEAKLFEHINLFWSRLNIPTLLQACKDNLHWKETVFLYTHYDQYDNAIEIICQHSPSCWEHEQFKSIIVRVSNTEVFYRAINFYLNEHPMLLNELLIELSAKLDHKRVVTMIRSGGYIALIRGYLLHVQRENISVVNEAINEIFIEEENYVHLRESIDDYDAFDQIGVAQKLEKHNLLEFRRISAYLYKISKRWEVSIELSKRDELWQDAMETAAESSDGNLAEELIRFFVESQKTPKSCFAACLFTCYKFIRPDIVLELAWRNELVEFAMPYMVQAFREMSDRLEGLEEKMAKQELEAANANEQEMKDKEAAAAKAAANMYADGPLMLTSSGGAGVYNPQMGLGGPQMGGPQMGGPMMGGGGGFGGPQMGMGPPTGFGQPNTGFGPSGF